MDKKKAIELLKVCGMISVAVATFAERDDREEKEEANGLVLDTIVLNRVVADILATDECY